MSTISDVLTLGPAASPNLSNTFDEEGSGSFAEKLKESFAATDIPQEETTDNINTTDQIQPLSKPQQPFENCPTPEVSTGETNIAQPDEKTASDEATAQPDEVQLVQNGENDLAENIESKDAYELKQLLALLGAGKNSGGHEQTGTAIQSEPVLNGEAGGVKVAVFLPDGSAALTLSRAQNKTADDEGDMLQATVITAKGIACQNVTGESSGNGGGESTATDGKPANVSILNSAGCQNQLPSNTIVVASHSLADGGKTNTVSGQLTEAEQSLVSQGHSQTNESLVNAQDMSFDSQSVFGWTKNQELADDAARPASLITSTSQQGQIIAELSDDNKQQGTGVSLDSLLNKLNINQAKINTGQTKNQSDSASNNTGSSGLQHLISQSNVQMSVTEETTFSQATKPANNPPTQTMSSSIGEQILASVNASLAQPDRQITIQLNPPELGKVYIRFLEQQEQLTGLLEVDRAQTRAQLQQELPQIIQSLADSGIQIKRIEVVLSDADQSQQHTYKEQTLPDGSFQQQGFTQGSASDNGYSDEWLMNDFGYVPFSQPQQMLVTNSSINVLV